MKYTAINIGPVIKTISLARRPRELWAASYLFSYLMRCIIDQVPTDECVVIAPIYDPDSDKKVGLYPDRLFLRHNEGVDDIKPNDILERAWGAFNEKLYLTKDYFNLMHVTLDIDSAKDSIAIGDLNKKLDLLELCVYASNTHKDGKDSLETVMSLITERKNSELFKVAFGQKHMQMETLAEIAATQLNKESYSNEWEEFTGKCVLETLDEDPYSPLKSLSEYKSYHRYFCVVQADGDNMGSTIKSEDISDDVVKSISEALWRYGLEANSLISEYGGRPIYAGGDDLLFIAPVVGKNGTNIFDLAAEIEKKFQPVVDVVPEDVLSKSGKIPSLSFGISISYYKSPLYEALESARDCLFDIAKKGNIKHKVAWNLKKHSGETFEAVYSKSDSALDKAFMNLIRNTVDGQTVSVLSHKIKANWELLQKCISSTHRLNAFFKTTLDAPNDSPYFNAVKDLIKHLDSAVEIEDLSETLYTLLRTAKFIKGEDTKDE